MSEQTKDTRHHHLTPDEIKKGCIEVPGTDPDSVRICRMDEELKQGMTEMETYKDSVTFYGSARFTQGDEFYDRARALAYRISKELGHTVITGGGPGIMEAGNRGAFEAGGKSVGLTIKLPVEQKDNPYLTDEVPFYFFFARKVALSFSSEVFVFFPGGFGTLDEFTEILTLVQTKKMERVPIILFGSAFWKSIDELFRSQLLKRFDTISENDLSLYTITDSEEFVLETIRNAKKRKNIAEE